MMKLRWKMIGKVVRANGESTITYQAEGTDLLIESRKKAVPHANGIGHWMHTAYFLIDGDKETEYGLLCLAKSAAQTREEVKRRGQA
ncbi:MAG: hypothetical protein IJQ03_00430 [Firmicutes bacterium]|nr:hypothetical protein [Bacillota bacterium]